jgi:hypothetical protein
MTDSSPGRFVRFVVLACTLVFAVALPCPVLAQPLTFFEPSFSAAAAAAGFEARANYVIRFNACNREPEYTRLRAELAAGNFEHQGEDMTGILIAKAGHLRAFPNDRCIGKVGRDDIQNVSDCVTVVGLTDAPDAAVFSVVVPPACLLRQINEAVVLMGKDTVLGSSKLVCIESFIGKSKGEFDVNVRELVRLLYIAGPGERGPSLLTQEAIDHMYDSLLATRGPPSDDTYSVIGGCAEPARDEVGSPEDTADRHAWYRELGDDIGDIFPWLRTAFFKVVLFAVATPLALVAGPFLVAGGVDPTDLFTPLPWADIRVAETENHRLMIESSRYLVNADIIARLDAKGYDRVDEIREDQNKVRIWLLQRLQAIAATDFREYNARAYTRYSLNAVLNLHDFAGAHGDVELATAARIVLDLSEAKFAATSNRGRRTSPFRRLSEEDGFHPDHPGPAALYNIVSGADHEVVRAMLLANQTQLLPERPPTRDAMTEMIRAATSPYRLPAPVLATAVERRSFTQSILHEGVERVFQNPAYTITAGGVRTPATASLLGVSLDADRGIAMPTTIMPTIAGLTLDDLFRFDGVGVQHDRTANTCVAEGFACGVQPHLSVAFATCRELTSTSDEQFVFVDSEKCLPDASPGFYLAARIVACPDTFCEHGRRWGVMDIAQIPKQPGEIGGTQPGAFENFKRARRAALEAIMPDANGDATYSSAAGQRISFNLAESQPRIVAINGTPLPLWATTGGVIEADGRGRATIKGPGGPVTIDYSEWFNPRRSP